MEMHLTKYVHVQCYCCWTKANSSIQLQPLWIHESTQFQTPPAEPFGCLFQFFPICAR